MRLVDYIKTLFTQANPGSGELRRGLFNRLTELLIVSSHKEVTSSIFHLFRENTKRDDLINYELVFQKAKVFAAKIDALIYVLTFELWDSSAEARSDKLMELDKEQLEGMVTRALDWEREYEWINVADDLLMFVIDFHFTNLQENEEAELKKIAAKELLRREEMLAAKIQRSLNKQAEEAPDSPLFNNSEGLDPRRNISEYKLSQFQGSEWDKIGSRGRISHYTNISYTTSYVSEWLKFVAKLAEISHHPTVGEQIMDWVNSEKFIAFFKKMCSLGYATVKGRPKKTVLDIIRKLSPNSDTNRDLVQKLYHYVEDWQTS